jgi:hypothetical protein
MDVGKSVKGVSVWDVCLVWSSGSEYRWGV